METVKGTKRKEREAWGKGGREDRRSCSTNFN